MCVLGWHAQNVTSIIYRLNLVYNLSILTLIFIKLIRDILLLLLFLLVYSLEIICTQKEILMGIKMKVGYIRFESIILLPILYY